MEKKKKLLKYLIISYLITFAIYNIGGFEASDILLGCVFGALFVILGMAGGVIPVPRRVAAADGDASAADSDTPSARFGLSAGHNAGAACIVSAVWTLLYAVYAHDRLGGGMENRLFVGVYTLLTLAGIFALTYGAVSFALNLYEHGYAAGSDARTVSESRAPRFGLKLFLIYAGIILVCMMPLFILNFPGTMTVDSFYQLEMARGLEPYTDQHPWAHTLLIKLMFNIGEGITRSPYGGIAAYTILQMLMCACAVAYTIASFGEAGLGRAGRIALLCGYVLFPYNLAYAITMWKDVPFGASVLVLTVTLYRLCRGSESGRPGLRDIILLAVSGLGTCLFRHNGFYAFIVTSAVVCIIFLRKKSVRVPAVMLGVIVVTILFKGPVQNLHGVEKGEFAYNIPIPLQQIAYVIYHGGEITPDDMAMIERINDTGYLRHNFTPGGADPTEQWLIFGDSDYLESHKGEYLALWIRTGIRNPIAYLRAYREVTKGYYTTMQPEQTEFYGILPNWSGLEPKPIVGEYARVKINEILSKIHNILPVYAILYSPGACMQLLVLGCAIICMRLPAEDGRKRMMSGWRLVTYLPVVTIMLTVMIAAPLAADLRYAYPLMISMPALMAITLMTAGNRSGMGESDT